MATTKFNGVLAISGREMSAEDLTRIGNTRVAGVSPWQEGVTFKITGAGFFLSNTENAVLRPVLVTNIPNRDASAQSEFHIIFISMLTKEHVNQAGQQVEYRRDFNDLCVDIQREIAGMPADQALTRLGDLVGYTVQVHRTAYQSGNFVKAAIGMAIVGEREVPATNDWHFLNANK